MLAMIEHDVEPADRRTLALLTGIVFKDAGLSGSTLFYFTKNCIRLIVSVFMFRSRKWI